jgi:hypothetical protein
VLTTLFALRIAAQPLSLVIPGLPDFNAWHGGVMPYPLLLAFQLAVLAVMVATNRACAHGRLTSQPRLARGLTLFGTLYFVVMLIRLALGQSLDPAPAWFARPLPTLFHLVLAAWLLILARRLSRHAR